jgi:membrane protein
VSRGYAAVARGALGLLGRALVRAHRDGVARRASALAFTTLLSIVPLLAVVSIFVAETLRADDGRTLRLIAQLLPYREEAVVAALEHFVAQAASVSSLAVIGFLVTALMTFLSVQQALFNIFGVSAPPSLGRRILTMTLMVFWGPVLIGSVYGGLIYLARTRPAVDRVLDESFLLGALPMAATFAGLSMLFYRAARGRIRFAHATAGGLVATVLLELLKAGFGAYVASFTPVQRAVYGSFAIALFFVLSIQLAWWMLLYGAEVAACLGRPGAELRGARGVRPDPWVGLSALARLAAPGRPSFDDDQLAAELGLPALALRDHLGPLSDRGLLEAPLTPAGRWRLAVAPARVRLESVFDAYDAEAERLAHEGRKALGNGEPDRTVDAGDSASDPRATPALAALRSELAGARAAALAGLTLDDWLRPRRPGDAALVEALEPQDGGRGGPGAPSP